MQKETSKDVEVSRAAQGRLDATFLPEEKRLWQATLEAGVKAQRLIPGSVAVGGTAAALYAGHRLSGDTDFPATPIICSPICGIRLTLFLNGWNQPLNGKRPG